VEENLSINWQKLIQYKISLYTASDATYWRQDCNTCDINSIRSPQCATAYIGKTSRRESRTNIAESR